MSQGSPPHRGSNHASDSMSVPDFKKADVRGGDMDLTSSELLNATVRLQPSVIVQLLSDDRFCTEIAVEFVGELERKGHLLGTLEDLVSEQISAASTLLPLTVSRSPFLDLK